MHTLSSRLGVSLTAAWTSAELRLPFFSPRPHTEPRLARATMAPKYKLTYFDIRGVAEPIRFLLHYGNIEFEDVRVSFEDWPNVKDKFPNGQVPVLEIDGQMIPQSSAICRFLARKLGLAGDDDFDAMLIDVAVDTITDIRLEIKNRNLYTEDDLAKKKRSQDYLLETTLPPFFTTLERKVKENDGYFVKGKLSWADLYLAAIIDTLRYALNTDVLNPYPNLQALVEKVNNIPNIKKWVETRPVTDI